MEGRFSGCEDKKEEMNSSVKENGISKKIPNTKHPGNLGYYEKVKGQDTRLTYKTLQPSYIQITNILKGKPEKHYLLQ